MTPPKLGMLHATDLIRHGKLVEATAHIQQMLGAKAPVAAPDDAIEGSFVVLPEAKPRRARSPLGATLRHIARGGMPDATPRAAHPQGADAQFREMTYTGPQGRMDYMLYVPARPAQGPRPVVVMLHGCTQSPQDFAAGTGMNTHAEAEGFLVIYPAQPVGANMNKCWNWFRPSDQARDGGEPALIAEVIRAVLAAEDADPARVYVAGLSAGGAAALIVAQAYPDLIAAAGVHSGLAVGSAHDVGSAFSAMRSGADGVTLDQTVPTIIFHGTADTTVDVANAKAIARQVHRGGVGRRTAAKVTPPDRRTATRSVVAGPDGRTAHEVWLIDGAGHAWAGGSAAGSFTDPTGPDATGEMLRFFRQHRLP